MRWVGEVFDGLGVTGQDREPAFPDGAAFRIEIPSVEGPRVLEAVLRPGGEGERAARAEPIAVRVPCPGGDGDRVLLVRLEQRLRHHDHPAGVAWIAKAKDVIEVVGVLSHFANTEDVTEQTYATQQLEAFDAGLEKLRAALAIAGPLERHISASAAALLLPRARLDAVRIGISLYGLWASNETRLSARAVLGDVPALRPALSWRCTSQLTKWLPAGSYVGYGCTYRCPAETRIAVLPVGYFDGYPRILSGRAHVLVDGQRCPVLGRVMMNHLVIDVTRAAKDDGPVTATLMGRDGAEQLTADQLAGWAQTIHYEIVTRLGVHLRRAVIQSPS